MEVHCSLSVCLSGCVMDRGMTRTASISASVRATFYIVFSFLIKTGIRSRTETTDYLHN